MRAEGLQPSLPPLPEGFPGDCIYWSEIQYVQWLYELGPTEAGGTAATVISWRTLQAWQETSGIELQPWEARLLRRLSGDWLEEREKARKPDCPAPWACGLDNFDREAVTKKIGAAFAGLAMRPPKVGLR